ncbi:hypothetical protein [Hirschia baltica]|uniref:Rod shape-determining protein MreD n=1 Tax=Hirschia baltica (strain ATCC 49814 / DSM 5838 / IFAM 1418) TaxID=582402 RepID=C6XN15_HIRBI|nr:hypothetical protein [Hirschia baltica]ACT58185.1 hypothetical protein Hbal_0483 [Hirschia baltica ATCC 49814]
MNTTTRIRLFLGAVFAIVICMLGATPLLHHMPFPLTDTWPIAVLLYALSTVRLGMSIWAAVLIVFVGLFQDFICEAPLGAWALAGLCGYGAGLVARGSFRAMSASIPVEFVSIIIGSIAGLMGLSLAGDIAGGAQVIDLSLVGDLIWTLGLYYLLSPLFAPYDEALSV